MSANYSSAEIDILMNIAELAKRCGLRPSDADVMITCDVDDKLPYRLLFMLRSERDPNIGRFCQLLGVTGDCEQMEAKSLRDIEDRVDNALALAPRARTR